jgi:hypothetical protein
MKSRHPENWKAYVDYLGAEPRDDDHEMELLDAREWEEANAGASDFTTQNMIEAAERITADARAQAFPRCIDSGKSALGEAAGFEVAFSLN